MVMIIRMMMMMMMNEDNNTARELKVPNFSNDFRSDVGGSATDSVQDVVHLGGQPEVSQHQALAAVSVVTHLHTAHGSSTCVVSTITLIIVLRLPVGTLGVTVLVIFFICVRSVILKAVTLCLQVSTTTENTVSHQHTDNYTECQHGHSNVLQFRTVTVVPRPHPKHSSQVVYLRGQAHNSHMACDQQTVKQNTLYL